MGQRLAQTLSGYSSYRQRDGIFLFLLHRITGLGTLIFLTLHIVSTASVYFAPAFYNRFVTLFRHPLMMLAEIILVFCVIYHGVNGLRIAFFDLVKTKLWKRENRSASLWTTLVIATLLWLPAAGVMGYNLLRYGLKVIGQE